MEKNISRNFAPLSQNKTINVKAIFALLAVLIFWLNAASNNAGSGKQKEPVKQKTAIAGNTNIIQTDSISGYSINVNGRLNSVQITSDTPVGTSPETGAKQKNNSNSVEINGEGNSVNISQNKNAGKVTIQQNGNGNQVNVTQTNSVK